MKRALVAAAITAVTLGGAQAQVQQERFSYPGGLDPDGDNFLALRSLTALEASASPVSGPTLSSVRSDARGAG